MTARGQGSRRGLRLPTGDLDGAIITVTGDDLVVEATLTLAA